MQAKIAVQAQAFAATPDRAWQVSAVAMPLSNLEYVPLRLARRFLLSYGFLLRFGPGFPYWKTNASQSRPRLAATRYLAAAAKMGVELRDKSILEVGSGVTNVAGYALAAARTPRELRLFEPLTAFDAATDRAMLASVAAQFGQEPTRLRAAVKRIDTLDGVPEGTVDLICSHSVLEHVSDPPSLFRRLRPLLKPDGVMIHVVDYRDHFFKYPYHFLQFSRMTWDRWLNPGDLPRWRAYDHLEQLAQAGFRPLLLEASCDDRAFSRLAGRISADFRRNDPLLAVSHAVVTASLRRAP